MLLTDNNKFVIIREEKVYKIIIYENRRGNSDIADFIRNLRRKSASDKNARVNLNKTVAYLDCLKELGTRLGEPMVKHLDGEIWELRPLANRILFACVEGETIILLHHFVKKTNKTPRAEIEKAQRELKDYRQRRDENENMG